MTHEELLSRVEYFPLAGVFIWRPNPKDTGEARRWNMRFAWRLAGSCDTRGHVQLCIGGRMYAAHRLAWFYVTGEWPTGDIDHRDRVKVNNRFDNLRMATRSQNNANRDLRRDNSSGVIGVSWHKRIGKWAAYVGSQHVGYYHTKTDAAIARAEAAREAFGDFSPNDIVPVTR